MVLYQGRVLCGGCPGILETARGRSGAAILLSLHHLLWCLHGRLPLVAHRYSTSPDPGVHGLRSADASGQPAFLFALSPTQALLAAAAPRHTPGSVWLACGFLADTSL